MAMVVLNPLHRALRYTLFGAATVLSASEPPTSDLSAILNALGNSDPVVSIQAGERLRAQGKAAVPVLMKVLAASNPLAQQSAADVLGRLGPEAAPAVPALSEVLERGDDALRYRAITALGAMGPAVARHPTTLATLEALRQSPDATVRSAATRALNAILGAPTPRTWEQTQALVQARVPMLMKELGIPGVSVALLREGRVAWSGHFGLRERGGEAPVQADTVFEAASMTKPLFAYLVMQQVQAGRLDLDTPVMRYLPETFYPPQPWQARITARMLLTHTSGLPNWRSGGDERNGPLEIAFEPGLRLNYSGEGYFYLQRVLEHLTGEPLHVLAERELFRPLGMKHSSFVLTSNVNGLRARGHAEDGKILPSTNYAQPNAAFSLYTTAEDYGRFLAAMLRSEGPGTLEAKTLKAMLTHQVATDSREPIERPGVARGRAVFWGLGWILNSTEQGDIAYHTGTNSSGFRAYSQFSPERRSGLVILTNSLAGNQLWTRLIAVMGDL